MHIDINSLFIVIVVQWLGKHPEFSSNSFYAGGDSYSGKIVPALVQEISKGIICLVLYMILTRPLSPFIVSFFAISQSTTLTEETC